MLQLHLIIKGDNIEAVLTWISLLLKVPLIPLLCCICVVLLATLQRPTRGEELFIDEEVTKEKIIDERENEVLSVLQVHKFINAGNVDKHC